MGRKQVRRIFSPSVLPFMPPSFGPTHTRAAIMGFFFATGNSAGIVSSNVYFSTEAPRYVTGHAVAIAFSVMAVVVSCVIMTYNASENKRRNEIYCYVPTQAKDQEELDLFDRAKWGLKSLSTQDIVELGDRHPGKTLSVILQCIYSLEAVAFRYTI